jgi:hypothetical protein
MIFTFLQDLANEVQEFLSYDLPRRACEFDESPIRSCAQRQGAKLAHAPDLGLRNHRFQRVALHFKANAFYEWKTGISYKIVAVANGE